MLKQMFWIFAVGLLSAQAAEVRVEPKSGRDSVLADALARLDPGDTLILETGAYYESLNFRGLENVEIRAEKGGDVTIYSTRELPRKWKHWRGGIWKQKLDFDVWQLFNGDKLIYVARWPDATFEDGKLWRMMEGMRSTDGGYNDRKKEWLGKSRLGLIYDRPFEKPKTMGFREGDTRYKIDPSITFDNQPESLEASGKDFTGAVAVLNIGHWLTYARPITEHKAGSDHFRYDPLGLKEHDVHRFAAYHILGLAALDRPGEWWFDAGSKTVYYMPPTGTNPNQLPIHGKVRDFGLELQKDFGVRVSGIRFFGGGFDVRNSSKITVEDCAFKYPATHQFVLGDYRWFRKRNSKRKGNTMPSFSGGNNNRFINCTVQYCNAPLSFESKDMRVENCLFSDIEWEPNSNGGSGSVLIGEEGVFRRNTVMRCGNSEGVRAAGSGVTIELNHVIDMSNLQHDGSAINVGTRHHYRTRLSHNWAHDCNRKGMRFDYSGTGLYRNDGRIFGDGVFMKNVTWNTEPNECKGDRHLLLNNTVLNVNRYPDPFKEKVTLTMQGFKALHDIEGNMNSLGRNNLATLMHRSFNMEKKAKRGWKHKDGYEVPPASILPGVTDHNLREPGSAWIHLRDPANRDFRPKKESPIVNGGAIVKPSEIPSPDVRFPGLNYKGTAPDIGAYECGARRYWIPGRKEATASIPVPKNGAVDVPPNADLMFLEAYKTEHHKVYFGTSPDALKPVAEFQTLEKNIVNLPNFGKNKTYYWQVGAIRENGKEKRSKIWKFTTGSSG